MRRKRCHTSLMSMTEVIGKKKIRNPSSANSRASQRPSKGHCFPLTAKFDQNDLIMNIFMYKLWSVCISLCRYN